jgi:hypothetical protein
MLTVNQTTRAYSGKPGCMCGCNGEYKESERARKLAITQLLKDPRVEFDAWSDDAEGALFVVTATRNRVLYLNAAGVIAVRAMGYKEKA